jgi:hypothetical protein
MPLHLKRELTVMCELSVIMVFTIKNNVFRVVTTYNFVEIYQEFEKFALFGLRM